MQQYAAINSSTFNTISTLIQKWVLLKSIINIETLKLYNTAFEKKMVFYTTKDQISGEDNTCRFLFLVIFLWYIIGEAGNTENKHILRYFCFRLMAKPQRHVDRKANDGATFSEMFLKRGSIKDLFQLWEDYGIMFIPFS